jgi:hypothetical protein
MTLALGQFSSVERSDDRSRVDRERKAHSHMSGVVGVVRLGLPEPLMGGEPCLVGRVGLLAVVVVQTI